MQPSYVGDIVEREWRKTPDIQPGVLLDAFVLMPNHLHAIIILNLPGNERRPPPPLRQSRVPSAGLGAIVRGFKAAVTSAVRMGRPDALPIWQRDYHDRIIRSDVELQRYRQYIADNPLKWELDRYFEREANEASL